MTGNETPCPTLGKEVFANINAAQAAAVFYFKEFGGQRIPYKCKCGKFHLTEGATRKPKKERHRRVQRRPKRKNKGGKRGHNWRLEEKKRQKALYKIDKESNKNELEK